MLSMRNNTAMYKTRRKGTNPWFEETPKQKKETVSLIIIPQLLLQLTTNNDKVIPKNSHKNIR